MSGSGKMSLVVLRSWSDGPPKVRAIAPPDDDRAVYVPDHQGRFVTEEVKEDSRLLAAEQPPRSASSASQYKEISQKDGNQGHGPLSLLPESSYKKTADGTVYRKTPLQRCFAIAGTNRHSYTGAGATAAGLGENIPKASSLHLPIPEAKDISVSPTTLDSAGSPDSNPDASSLEYSPPASPVNGRYRNLGPELAATIPKRTVRNNWIAEMKSRFTNKNSSSLTTTHPSSRACKHSGGSSKRGGNGGSGSTLKSYSSSPSLICRNNGKNKVKTKKGVGKRVAAGEVSEEDDCEGEEVDDYYDDHFILRGNNGETLHQHRRCSLQRIDNLDEGDAEEEHRQPVFNPLYKFSHSKNSNTTNNSGTNDDSSIVARSRDSGNFSLMRSHLKSTDQGGTRSASSLLNSRSTSGIALSVDDDSQSDRSRSSLGYTPSNNSGNTSYSPSPPLTSTTPNEHIYSSLTDIRNEHQNNGKGGRIDPFKLEDPSATSDVVLVEIIRKQGKSIESNDSKSSFKSSPFGDKLKLEKFGSVELIQKLGNSSGSLKRHSIGDIEPSNSANVTKSTLLKSESSPGKVARFKESLKRFGRFGRGHTDKIVRTQSDSGFSTDDLHGSCDFKDSVFEIHKISLKDSDNLYENPAEIIVTSLANAEKDLGITVKPAPRRRSKPILESSPESIYEFPTNSLRSCSTTSSSSEQTSASLSSPSPTDKAHEHQPTLLVENVTDQKSAFEDDDNLIKQKAFSASEATEKSSDDNEKNDRVSPTIVINCDEVKAEKGDFDRHIPHLEFDKGDHSASHDESCSSRAESLTYSSTSHEQDRSMPQQIVQHLLPKVDILNGSSDDAANISIDSGSSGTLNCEVTPVIRKRSFENFNEQLVDGSTEKQQITKQLSSSSVEHVDGGDNKVKDASNEDENVLKTSKTNKESDCYQKVEEKEDQQQTLSIPLVPLNERSEVSENSRNMNSLNRTRHKINIREIVNGQNHSNQSSYNSSPMVKTNGINGSAGPEMINSKVETKYLPDEISTMGKFENGTASVQVPVQAVNRHVLGYGISTANSLTSDNSCNTIMSDDEQPYNGSIASTTSKNDSEWNKSSLRASLRGFCQDLLQNDKISIPVPDVVDAVINFDEDSSSIEQDEERENSIEYISVANVKVNREKRLDKLHPRDEIPSCVIALDLGSRGSGYAYWIKEEAEFVRIGNVNGASSCPASHKAPSWVMFDDLYLDGDEDGESSDSIRPGFGFQALDKYLTDDAHGQIQVSWREHFHEGRSFPYTLDSKASDDDLVFMMKSAIRHYGRQAMDQISQRKKGAPLGPTVILIAIPSTFDRRARQLVRDAALEAGVLSESDSVALIEDSCATGLYSLHALKSTIQKESNSKVTEISYLSVDCGASYLHLSGFQLVEGKLKQLVLSRSDPLIDSPETLFEAELSSVFTPNYIFNYQNKYKAGWLKLMTEFEGAKNRYDPLSKQNYYVFVPSSFVDHFRRFTNMEVEDALESSDMVWNKTGALGVPYWKMQRFLQPLLDYINNKVGNSMRKHKFDHLVLTGGRAGAKFYVDSIRTAAKGFGATLHVPKEHNAAVLQGSTISLTNLAPRLVIISRFSIGVGVMTPFSEENHPEEKRVMRDGKAWAADVWDSLIRVDQELELNRVIIKRSYVGAMPGQSLLVLPLFKSPDEPKFVTESSVQKCCELKFTSGQRAWQEVELVLVCRPSEIIIKAMDGGVMKSYVVVDFSD